jgi:hypothetical protein
MPVKYNIVSVSICFIGSATLINDQAIGMGEQISKSKEQHRYKRKF